MGLRSVGNKDAMIYRNFLIVRTLMERGKDFHSAPDPSADSKRFQKLLSKQKDTCGPWTEPPSHEVMKNALQKVGDKFDEDLGTRGTANGAVTAHE